MCLGTFPAFERWWVQALLWLDVVSSSGTLPAVGQHALEVLMMPWFLVGAFCIWYSLKLEETGALDLLQIW